MSAAVPTVTVVILSWNMVLKVVRECLSRCYKQKPQKKAVSSMTLLSLIGCDISYLASVSGAKEHSLQTLHNWSGS